MMMHGPANVKIITFFWSNIFVLSEKPSDVILSHHVVSANVYQTAFNFGGGKIFHPKN
jgi:hypothetical protein